MNEKRDIIYIYADGGVRNNQSKQNIGAWGIVMRFNGIEKTAQQHEYETTNNRMELLSAINGLKRMNKTKYPIVVVMDSQYVISGITNWIYKWMAMGWRTANGSPVKNIELWQQLFNEVKRLGNVTFEKCSGHSDNDGNNMADKLCNDEMDKAEGYYNK